MQKSGTEDVQNYKRSLACSSSQSLYQLSVRDSEGLKIDVTGQTVMKADKSKG